MTFDTTMEQLGIMLGFMLSVGAVYPSIEVGAVENVVGAKHDPIICSSLHAAES